jgi:hypothetical protein
MNGASGSFIALFIQAANADSVTLDLLSDWSSVLHLTLGIPSGTIAG